MDRAERGVKKEIEGIENDRERQNPRPPTLHKEKNGEKKNLIAQILEGSHSFYLFIHLPREHYGVSFAGPTEHNSSRVSVYPRVY